MQQAKPSNSRIHAIDRAKVLCAFLVIYAHLFHHDSKVRLYIYAFHMALFFLISGMFFKPHEDFWKGVISYCKRMILPAIYFDALLIIIYAPLYYYNLLPHQAINENLFSQIISQLYRDFHLLFFNGNLFNRVVWFLFALFWCNVFLSLLNKIKIIGAIVPFAIFAIYYLFQIDVFYSVQGAMAFPFFLIGNKCKPLISRYTSDRKWMTYLIFTIICLIITICLTQINGRVSFKSCILGNLSIYLSGPLFFINGAVGSWMIISIVSMIPFKGRWVTAFSKSLISTLGYQYLFIIAIQTTTYQPTLWNAIPISIIILIGCHLLHQMTEKYIPFCIGR